VGGWGHSSVPKGTLGSLHPDTRKSSFELISSISKGVSGQMSKVRKDSIESLYAKEAIRGGDPREVRSIPYIEACEERHNAETSLPPCRQRKCVRPRNNSFSIIILPMTGCDRFWHPHQRNIVFDFPQMQIGHLTSWLGWMASPLSFVHANMTKHEDIKSRNIGKKMTSLT
jgi:hypothetical protein